jgi:hypothetical protein
MTQKPSEKLRAAKWVVVPYSSIVGQSIAAHDQHGAVFAQASISIPRPSLDYKDNAVPLAEQMSRALNHFDAYGIALMMIAEGADNPADIARKAIDAARADRGNWEREA